MNTQRTQKSQNHSSSCGWKSFNKFWITSLKIAQEGSRIVKTFAPRAPIMLIEAFTNRLATGLRSGWTSKQMLTAFFEVSNNRSIAISISSMQLPISPFYSLELIASSTFAKCSGLYCIASSTSRKVTSTSLWSLFLLWRIRKEQLPMVSPKAGKSGFFSPMHSLRGSSCSCLCFLRLHMQRYYLLQPLISQTYRFRFSLSSKCTCTCCLRLVVVVNDLQHFSQMKGFSWV